MDINVARFAGEIVSFIRPYRLLGKKKTDNLSDSRAILQG